MWMMRIQLIQFVTRSWKVGDVCGLPRPIAWDLPSQAEKHYVGWSLSGVALARLGACFPFQTDWPLLPYLSRPADGGA